MATPAEQYYANKARKAADRQQRLAQATAILRERQAVAAQAADIRAQSEGDYATPSGEIDRSMGRAATYGSQVVRGFGSMMGAIPKGVADITQLATGYNPEGMREVGDDVEGYFNQADVNPEYADDFGGKVAHGVGTTLGFFAGGVAGAGLKGAALASKGVGAARALNAASLTAKGLTPVTSGINEMTEDFRRTVGRDPTREELATLVPSGTALGAMEYLPVSRALGRIPGSGNLTKEVRDRAFAQGGEKAVKAAVRRDVAKRIGKGTAEEFIQEGTQQVAQNFAAKSIAKYDKDRDVFEGLGEAASVGGASGFVINSALMLAGMKMRGSAKEAEEGVTEEDTEDMEKDLDEVQSEGMAMAEKEAIAREELIKEMVATRKELAVAKESESTNPEEVKAIEDKLAIITKQILTQKRENQTEHITIESERTDQFPEDAYDTDPEEIVLGDERLGNAQLEADKNLAQFEQDELAATVDGISVEEGLDPMDVEEIEAAGGPRPPGPYADRPGARPKPTKKEMQQAAVRNRLETVYGDNLALEKPSSDAMLDAPIPLEEWNAGPLKGQYPGRNYVGQAEVETTGDLDLPPEMAEDMRADTKEANEQEKKATAKLPKAKKTAKKAAGKGGTPTKQTGRATLPSAKPVSVAAKRGKAAKTAVSKIAKARQAVTPISLKSLNKTALKTQQDISDWAAEKGTVPAGEHARVMKQLKAKLLKEWESNQDPETLTKKEISTFKQQLNKFIKKATPTKEAVGDNAEAAEKARPTSAESLAEELAAIPGAVVLPDGTVSVPVDNEGSVETPEQMQELFQHENIAGVRSAYGMLNADVADKRQAQHEYLLAIHKYIMSRIKQPRETPADKLAMEVRLEVRDAINLLSNEGILPPQFTEATAQNELTASVLEEYTAGDPMVANLVTVLEQKYPLNEDGKSRSMKGDETGHKLDIRGVNKEALNEALTKTSLFLKSVNLDGQAVVVNMNKHTEGRSPTQVLGNAPTSIDVTPDKMVEMTTVPEVTQPPAQPTPLYNEAEAAKVSPVTGTGQRAVPPAGRATPPSAVAPATQAEPIAEETVQLAEMTDVEIDLMKGPEVTAHLKEQGFNADEIPHKVVDRKNMLKNAVGEAQDYLGEADPATGGYVNEYTDEDGTQIKVQSAEAGGKGASRLAAFNRSLPEVTKEEADRAELDPNVDPRNSPFSDEGAAPRNESGVIEIDENETGLSELERKLYSGETLTKSEQTLLDKQTLDDLMEVDDYTSVTRDTDEVYKALAPTGRKEELKAYTPAGKAMRKELKLVKENTGKPAKLRDILKTLYDTLPYGSSDRSLVKLLMDLNLGTTIELVDTLDSHEGKAVGGEYNKTKEHIKVSGLGLDGDISWITLHESIHAATIHGYDSDAKFRSEINNIYWAARAAYEKIVKRDADGKLVTGIDGVNYSMTSPTEFLAEIFTNPNVMKFANNVQYMSGKHGKLANLFNAFMDTLKSWLGMTVREHSVLRNALVVGYRGFRDQLQIDAITDEQDALLHSMDPFYDTSYSALTDWAKQWAEQGTGAPKFKAWAGQDTPVVEPLGAADFLKKYENDPVLYEKLNEMSKSTPEEAQKLMNRLERTMTDQHQMLVYYETKIPEAFIPTSNSLLMTEKSPYPFLDERTDYFNEATEILDGFKSNRDVVGILESGDLTNLNIPFRTGESVVVRGYHGSTDPSIGRTTDGFDFSRAGSNTNSQSAKDAVWFSHDPKVANSYSRLYGSDSIASPTNPLYQSMTENKKPWKERLKDKAFDKPMPKPDDWAGKPDLGLSIRDYIKGSNGLHEYDNLTVLQTIDGKEDELTGYKRYDFITEQTNEVFFQLENALNPDTPLPGVSYTIVLKDNGKYKEPKKTITKTFKTTGEVRDFIIKRGVSRFNKIDTFDQATLVRGVATESMGKEMYDGLMWGTVDDPTELLSTTYPAYIKFKNPLVTYYGNTGYTHAKPIRELTAQAKEEGRDGIIIVGISDGGPNAIHYATIDPKANVRSLFNKGEFKNFLNAPPSRASEAPTMTASERIAESMEDFGDIREATEGNTATSPSGSKVHRPFEPSWKDRQRTPLLMEASTEIDQADIDAAHGIAARAGNWINKVQNSKHFDWYRMLGGLSNKKAYMTARGQSMGLSSQMDELANYFGTRLSGLSEQVQTNLIDYFTTKDATVDRLPQELQADAVWAKEEIMRQALALEELGFLEPSLNEETLGKYLPNVYLMWMLDPSGEGKINTTGGAGAKTSLQNYLKQKNKFDDNTKEILGMIHDPALLTAHTIANVGRDIAVLDFLRNINDFAKKQGDKPWVFPGSDKYVVYDYENEDGELQTDLRDTIPIALSKMAEYKERMITKGFKDDSKRALPENFYQVQMDKINDSLMELYEQNVEAGNAAVHPDTLKIDDYTFITEGKRNGDLSGQWVRNEIYDDIRANTFAFSTGETSTAEKLLGQDSILTKGNRFWKATKTIYNLPSHGRNFVSNFINWDISTDTSTSEITKILWDTAGDWMAARKKGDKYPQTRVWELADKFGITETTWTAQEAIRFQKEWQKMNRKTKMDDWIDNLPDGLPFKGYVKEYLPQMTGKGIRMMTFMGEAYQGNETLFKVAKLQDELNKLAKQYPEAAANPESLEWQSLENIATQEASRMIFDYSNVTKSVKYLRNAPIGAPFMSFAYLAAPRIIENTVKHPVKMMKYISMPYLFGELAASLGVFDDDDWETAKNKAPGFLKDKHTLLPMPWKDENGDPIVWDLAYYLPYAPFLETAHQYKNILSGEDTETGLHTPLLRNFGILSGPVPDVITAMKTNVDPFTQQQIVDPRGSAGSKAADAFMYAWSVAAPTFITHHGLAGNIYKQITKKDLINPRTMEERTSPTEAVLRGLGVSVYSYDPDDSRGVNARYYKSLLAQQISADKKKMKKLYTEGASFEAIAKERRNAAERQKIYRKNHQDYLRETQ